MRNLSANALAKIASTHGNEPVTILEVDWIEDGGSKLYADRTIGAILGKILSVSDLDNVVSVSNNDSSQELSITLEDTDGTIKEIIDTHDIHKRNARVYQWFSGMDLDDRFLLFAGKISTPITWSERERTIAFTIISQLEDKEIGFSAEEGEFPWIPKDLIDKPWPMVFGTVQDVPCMQFNHAVSGSTLCGVGIVSGKSFADAFGLGGNDNSFFMQMAGLSAQIDHLSAVEGAYNNSTAKGASGKAKDAQDQRLTLINQRTYLSDDHWKNEVCAEWQKSKSTNNPTDEGCNPVRILGGEDFPQGIGMTIRIGQGLFTGYFADDLFHISDRLHEDNETRAESIYDGAESNSGIELSDRLNQLLTLTPQYRTAAVLEELCNPVEGISTIIQTWEFKTNVDGVDVKTTRQAIIPATSQATDRKPTQIAQHYWAEAGTSVVVYSSEPITYVVSIIPGTVLSVKAYKDFENERRLLNVPTSLYTVATVDYGPVTAVQITFDKSLSTIADQGWDDDIYVTFESSVGPHTCDILQYIITNYTDLDYDATAFTAVRTNLDSFPMNFPILEKKSTLTVLQEIAFQARCALWISNGVFYIKYLPEEPSNDSTISLSDIDAETGILVELSSTEDLVTKMIVEWRISWNEDKPNKVILRHNVKKYGTQTEDFFFYCFNQPDIVLKAATFWLIRNSNTWKRVRFSTYLQKLELETFDTALLDFGATGHVSTGSVKSIVEQATYNSSSNLIDFVCLTPVKSGSLVEYEFFWPSQISTTAEFPTPAEQAAGYGGGDGIGAGATGELPIGFTDPDNWGSGVVWVGGPNVIFTGPADHGETYPSDIGFVAQPVVFTDQYAELSVSPNPDPSLEQVYKNDVDLRDLAEMKHDRTPIDIRTTPIIDSDLGNASPVTYLDTFFKKINVDEKLVVDCDVSKWGNTGDSEDGTEFHFKYDEDYERFGAGTAFLFDPE